MILAACTALLSGCVCSFNSGSGITVQSYSEEGIDFTEERTVAYFDSFSSYGPFNVYFVQSESQKILVEGKEESVKKVITEVKDHELSIKLEKGRYEHLVLRVTIFSPNIEDIETYGSGKMVCGSIEQTGADIELSSFGSGGILVDSLICKELSMSTSGSGGVRVSGIIIADEDVDINTMGSGSILLNAVSCQDLEASTLGSGGISIDNAMVSFEMDLSSTGSGSISVNGKCRKVDASTMGSGSIYGQVEYSEIKRNSLGSGKVKLYFNK